MDARMDLDVSELKINGAHGPTDTASRTNIGDSTCR